MIRVLNAVAEGSHTGLTPAVCVRKSLVQESKEKAELAAKLSQRVAAPASAMCSTSRVIRTHWVYRYACTNTTHLNAVLYAGIVLESPTDSTTVFEDQTLSIRNTLPAQ